MKNKQPFLFLFFLALTGFLSAKSLSPSINLSGEGWRVSLESNALYEYDELFEPNPSLVDLPASTPANGWHTLSPGHGTAVSVPNSIEQIFPDKHDESGMSAGGVSWWWREIEVPRDMMGKRIILRFESLWCRAEIYIDGILVGYELAGGVPFDCDITEAVIPGRTQTLAVKITSPEMPLYPDGNTIKWNIQRIPSHLGYAGITGEVSLRAEPPARIESIHAINRADDASIVAGFVLRNEAGPLDSLLELSIIDFKDSDKIIYSTQFNPFVLKDGFAEFMRPLNNLEGIERWNPENPKLYNLRAKLQAGSYVSEAETTFGFRYLSILDAGSRRNLILNSTPIFLAGAEVPATYFPRMFAPSKEAASRLVHAIKKNGFNLIVHRDAPAHPNLLEAADQIGMLVLHTVGGYGAPNSTTLTRRLLVSRASRLIENNRSHPSLVATIMSNHPDPVKPTQLELADLDHLHRLDPSRFVFYTLSDFEGRLDSRERYHSPFSEKQTAKNWDSFSIRQSVPQLPDDWFEKQNKHKYQQFSPSDIGICVSVNLPLPVNELGLSTSYHSTLADYSDEPESVLLSHVNRMSMNSLTAWLQNSIIDKETDGYFFPNFVATANRSPLRGVMTPWLLPMPEVDPYPLQKTLNPPTCVVRTDAQVLNIGDSLMAEGHIITQFKNFDDALINLELLDPRGALRVSQRFQTKVQPSGSLFSIRFMPGLPFSHFDQPGIWKIRLSGDKKSEIKGDEMSILVLPDIKLDKSNPGMVFESGNAISVFLSTGVTINNQNPEWIVCDTFSEDSTKTILQQVNDGARLLLTGRLDEWGTFLEKENVLRMYKSFSVPSGRLGGFPVATQNFLFNTPVKAGDISPYLSTLLPDNISPLKTFLIESATSHQPESVIALIHPGAESGYLHSRLKHGKGSIDFSMLDLSRLGNEGESGRLPAIWLKSWIQNK